MRTTIKRPAAGPPSADDRTLVGNQITRVTAGHPRPLRINWALLDEQEQRDLVLITRKADQEDGFGLGRLSKRDRARWEKLAEKGGAQPGYFACERDADALTREMAGLAAELAKPPRRVRCEEPGSIRLPRSVFEGLDAGGRNPTFKIGTLGILAFVLLSLENGRSLTPGGTIEGTGDDATLVIDGRLGLGARFGEFPDWRMRVDHLHATGWFEVEKRGQLVRIRRGPLALKTAKGT